MHGDYILEQGGYIHVHGGYILVHGDCIPVHGGYIQVHGGFILVHGSYILVHGGYIQQMGVIFRYIAVIKYHLFHKSLILQAYIALLCYPKLSFSIPSSAPLSQQIHPNLLQWEQAPFILKASVLIMCKAFWSEQKGESVDISTVIDKEHFSFFSSLDNLKYVY